MCAIARAFVLSSLAAFFSMAAFAQTATVPVTLDNLRQLGSPDVVDPTATLIGTVVKVKSDSDGKVQRVMVMLSTSEGQGRVAAIRPERLSADKARRVLVADFTAAQLSQLAATATVPTGIDTGRSAGMVYRHSSPDNQSSGYNPNGAVMPY